MASNETPLKTLFQKHRDLPVESLLPEELNLLIDSFLPFQNASIRAQSLLFLSKFCSDTRLKYSSHSSSDVPTAVLVRTFSALIEARLASTNESITLTGLSFLAALFQVDWESACEIFSRDGFLDAVMDTPDLHPSQAVSVAVASLLSQASGHKQCRSFISAPVASSWLEKSTIQTTDSALRGAAAVALVKLSRGSKIDAQSKPLGGITMHPSSTPLESSYTRTDDRLVELMKKLVMTEARPSSTALDAVEGLAYLTVQAAAKEAVSTDSTFLKCLLALLPRCPSAPSFPASHADRNVESLTAPALGLNYGIAVIISNLCTYKPRLSDEEKQIERLRRMTAEPTAERKLSAEATRIADQEKLDNDNHVRIRGKKLMDIGVAEALTGIIKNLNSGGIEKTSIAAQRAAARAFLSLVEEKTNRGRILQEGGAKALLTIIRVSIAEFSFRGVDGQGDIDKLDSVDLLAIQALAQLSITSPPAAVFGPAYESYVDAIRPFAILLIHSSSSLLQRFEAVMALTNITSVSPEAAERVSSFRFKSGHSQTKETPVGDIVKRVETYLLDGNIMLRRASTELTCNLVGGAEGSFDYFGGGTGSSSKSRLQILVALSDVDDLPTRLAASGALAILTSSPNTCQALAALEMERHRVLPMLVELLSPEIAREYREERPEDEEAVAATDVCVGDLGLIHRGVVCVHNLFANLDAKEERKNMSLEADKRGLARALILTIKSDAGGTNNVAILKPAAEVLKWIVQSGVKLPL